MQIFVLGMHRSGTSVVTRLINLMGAHFGPEELSTGANPENPRGFWERRDVRDENDAVLWSSGADWWKVADFSLESVPVNAQKRFSRNVPEIIRNLDTHRPWVVKEPRLCLLFPMWQRHVETPICVLVHRPPIQVAHSLEYRNEFPLSVGVALWERYVLDALKWSTGFPRILVSFEDIMADPIAQVDQLLGNLTNAGVDGLNRPSDADITSFVSHDLFRHRHPKEEQLDLLNSDQLELASAMESGAVLELGDVPTLSAQAERTLRLFEEISKNKRLTDSESYSSKSPSVDREESQKKQHEPNSELATVRARAMAQLHESKNLRADFEKLDVEYRTLRKRAKTDRLEIEKLHTRLHDTEKSLDRARSTSKSRAHSLKLIKEDVETSAKKIAELEEQCRNFEARSNSAEKEVARTSDTLEIAENERRQALQRIGELEPQVAKLVEAEAARDHESNRASDLEITVGLLETELGRWRNEAAKSKSRQNDLERSTEELLVFLRRAQRHFEEISNEPARRFGPFELRSQRKSAAGQDRLNLLFRQIGAWVQKHRDELVAMINPVSTDRESQHGLPKSDRFLRTQNTDELSIDVIVCVHDSLEEVRRCLASVISTIGRHHTLIVVDDGSGEETAQFLNRFASIHDHVKLVRRDSAGGYTKAANSGIENSSAEFIVLLNSDTQVPTAWLKKLARAAYQSNEIGIVGPLSNAASWQSVPEIIDENGQLAVNQIPAGFTVEDMDRIVESCSTAEFPRVDLANGFCFGIKRIVLDTIGTFDEESFPRGYGEENDFCFRAADAEFRVVIATDCYVYHEKSRSYSPTVRDRLAKESGAILQKKYPVARIRKSVEECKENPILVGIREQFRQEIGKAVKSRESDPDRNPRISGDSPLRILFVLPVRGGGGGVHSIVQETMGIREVGAHASVAVPGKATDRYCQRYPNVDPSVFVGFNNVEELTTTAEEYDVVVATIFTSVKLIRKIVERVPRLVPAYYIQDYEPWICRNNESLQREAFDSYGLIPNMIRFAKTDWIRHTVEEKHGVPVQKVMPSLDTSVYFPRSDQASETGDDRPVRIAAMVRPKTPRRAAGSTMEILSSIKKQYGDLVDITVFGCDPEEEGFLALHRDFDHEHLGVLIREEVAEALRKSDVFVDFSTYQAFGRTALEAMACGCAVIVPEHGGTSEYAENDVNALVVDTTDKNACIAATQRLVETRELRKRLSRNAKPTAARYSTRAAAASILAVLSASVETYSVETASLPG